MIAESECQDLKPSRNGVHSPDKVAPSDTEDNGTAPAKNQDARGRFVAGNTCGRGNPFARRMASLRSSLLQVLTPERMQALGEKLYARALRGDCGAAKLLLVYSIGKPVGATDPDTLDLQEWLHMQSFPSRAEVLATMLDAQDPAMAVEVIDGVLPKDDFAKGAARLMPPKGEDDDDEDDDDFDMETGTTSAQRDLHEQIGQVRKQRAKRRG
jgi:hypothetical protein